MEYITQIEFVILNSIQQLRNPVSDYIFSFITQFGNGGFLWILLALIMLFHKKYRKSGVLVLCSLALTALVFTVLVKNIVGRERPFNNINGIIDITSLIINAPSDRFSFPSGHTVSSFVASTIIFLAHKRLGAVCFVVALLISFSRLYLYVHYPSDILFGALFGILSALVVNFCENKLSNRIRKRNSQN